MKRERWQIWMEDVKLIEMDFDRFVQKKLIRKGASNLEIEGHLNKAKRNLRFARRIIDDFKEYYEWSIVTYYYAIYQAALALCAHRGFKTKKHQATLLILIKFYYPSHLKKEDLQTLATIALEETDIQAFATLKQYREDATYSISTHYEKDLSETLGSQAIEFISKVERILREM